MRELRSKTPLLTNDPLWRVLCVEPRRQQLVASLLAERYSIEIFNPHCTIARHWSRNRVRNASVPIFSGYLFARFSWDQHGNALGTGGVRSILSFAGLPAEVNAAEMERLRLIAMSDTPVNLVPPPQALTIGEKVEIVYGPMTGMTGVLVQERGKLRLIVNIEGMRMSGRLEVARDQVRPKSEPKQ